MQRLYGIESFAGVVLFEKSTTLYLQLYLHSGYESPIQRPTNYKLAITINSALTYDQVIFFFLLSAK